jgi:hypothetical protein
LLTYPAQYQPLWTFVGSGLKTLDESKMAMKEVMPEKAQWIKDSVASFNPTQNTVVLANGESVRIYSHQYRIQNWLMAERGHNLHTFFVHEMEGGYRIPRKRQG